MYERFTDDARRAMQAANQQAIQAKHEYIGTDDVLVGIATHPGETVTLVFKLYGVDLPRLKACLANLSRLEGPNTHLAKTVIENAMKRSRELYHMEVNSAHVLLGLLDCLNSDACRALQEMSIEIEQMKVGVLSRLPVGSREEVTRRYEIEQRFKNHPDVVALMQQIEELQAKQEKAIVGRDLQLAASFRDQKSALRKLLEEQYKKFSE